MMTATDDGGGGPVYNWSTSNHVTNFTHHAPDHVRWPSRPFVLVAGAGSMQSLLALAGTAAPCCTRPARSDASARSRPQTSAVAALAWMPSIRRLTRPPPCAIGEDAVEGALEAAQNIGQALVGPLSFRPRSEMDRPDRLFLLPSPFPGETIQPSPRLGCSGGEPSPFDVTWPSPPRRRADHLHPSAGANEARATVTLSGPVNE